MEDKTKSTLAHVASIATAIAGVVTALVTGSANDSTSEKIYETLRERVTIQGEHIKMLEEDKKVKDAWILQHLDSPRILEWGMEEDGDGVLDEPDPTKQEKHLISGDAKPLAKPKASAKAAPKNGDPLAELPPPPPPPPEPVQQSQQAFSPMPSYGSL